MSQRTVSEQLDDVNTITSNILDLLNSRRTGNTSTRVGGPTIPEINLTQSDITQIFADLHQMGTQLSQIVHDARTRHSHHEINQLTQNMINNHGAALSMIILIRQGQMNSSDHGMMIAAIAGLQNSILDLQSVVITLDSYTPPRGGSTPEPPDTNHPQYNWSKIGAIIGVLALILTVGGYFLFTTPIEQTAGDVNVENSNQVIVNSGFGDIILNTNTFNIQENKEIIEKHGLLYRNEELGFEIARPNIKWYFDTDLSELKLERTGTLPEERFLGGIYVGTNTDENVFVSVFDISELNKNSLEDYVDSQIQWVFENFDEAKLRTKQIATNGQWALFGIEVSVENKKIYGEQILEIREDKLYMLQASGAVPEEMDLEKKEELRKIIDSFIPI